MQRWEIAPRVQPSSMGTAFEKQSHVKEATVDGYRSKQSAAELSLNALTPA